MQEYANTDLDSIEAVPDLLDLLSFGANDLPVEALVNDDVLFPLVFLPGKEHTLLSEGSDVPNRLMSFLFKDSNLPVYSEPT